jgi:type I restriction enzyme, R subunit
MSEKEAHARIKINDLLSAAGWRFEDGPEGPANIKLEPGVRLSDLSDDSDPKVKSDGKRGAIDFLLLDKDKKPLLVLEAKARSIDPLAGKEQARRYALAANARFIILSNGDLHYFWDTEFGNPETIVKFPTPDSISQHRKYLPNPDELASTVLDENYIIATQYPNYASDPDFQDPKKLAGFLKKNNLKQMRPYQVDALRAIQENAKKGSQRYLFEMATGTGKTLISSAVIKMFLKSGNAHRVLFLVDRLELEDQAYKAFVQYLGKDYTVKIF